MATSKRKSWTSLNFYVKFTSGLSYIASILFTPVKFYVCSRGKITRQSTPKSALDSESRKWKRSILHECLSGKNTYSQRSLAAEDKATLWSNYSRYFMAIFTFSRNWSRSVECLALRFSTVDVILAAKSSTAWFISFLVLCLKSPRKPNKNKNR